ncbi:MAG: Crp/Fnr family transcriptional regulator [Alphaproteobacteria bacterium]|nr:Crp/Fnr family transcriptional regulator [Alphaproteobacteria bacterium]
MIGVDVVQRQFALRAAGPFQRLEDAELLLIARHARPRTFAAGKLVIPAGTIAEALFVAPVGGAYVDGVAAPGVFDAPGLLFGLAARADYIAGPEGLEALVIAKPHVFTIARECPEFVVGLRDLVGQAAS